MADAARQEKLAAARKKLKKFQEKGTKGGSGNTTPASIVNKKIKLLDDPPLQRDSVPSTNNNHQIAAEAPENVVVFESNLAKEPLKTKEEKRPSISSSESIRQISLQLNGLMSQTDDFLNGDVEVESSKTSELEKRNLELAAAVEKHIQTIEHLTSQIQELKNHNNKLRQSLQQQQEDSEQRHLKEQGSLKEQLQVHIQTIGILVAEKTELHASLTQSQQTAKQKAGEVEELQGRLRATRQRISDIERDLNAAVNSSQLHEKNSKEYSKEIDRLKLETYKNNKKMEELQQQNSELSEKLNNKIQQSQNMQQELDEARSSLAMAELRVQQLSGSDDNKHFLEELSEEKIKLEKNVSQLKESMQKLSQERDSMAEQYQLFSQQLSQQVQNLSQNITSLNEEKASLANEKIVLSNRVQSLEDQLDQLQTQSKTIPFADEETERLRAMLQLVEEEKGRLQEQHEKDMSDNVTLSRLTEELERRVQELQTNLELKREDDIGRQHLLEEMESDKVATSRAMAQNRELKKQLEELQNGFIVMSNNKLELVEKLESEQYVTKELGERLSQQEDELKELREQLLMRDRELNSAQQSSADATKQMYQQHQLMDRVRHYEAQGQLSELLQQELTKTQERLSVLGSQNSELRTMLARQGQQFVAESSDEDRESSRRDDLVSSLSSSVNQLEMERDALLRQLGEQQGQREVFRAQLKEMKESKLHHQNGVNGESVSSEQYEHLKHVLHQLEERFTKTMREIAELSDQKQQLEHLVTQLQGETETIGEYIALYQVQRSIMKQRALEKDEYIAQLAGDREDLKSKLSTLQDLVMRLLYERQQYNLNGQGDSIRAPGKAVASLSSSIDLSALNGAADFPDWPDLEDEFDKANLGDLQLSKDGVTNKREISGNGKQETDTTAKKIMDLITEIGSSSLVEKPTLDNFHPCSVCSGKLMTV